MLSHSVMSNSLWPQGMRPPQGSSLHQDLDSPGKNIRVGCHTLLQGIFPTQGWNPGNLHRWQNTGVGKSITSSGERPDPGIEPGFLHCRQVLYQLSYLKSPILYIPSYYDMSTWSLSYNSDPKVVFQYFHSRIHTSNVQMISAFCTSCKSILLSYLQGYRHYYEVLWWMFDVYFERHTESLLYYEHSMFCILKTCTSLITPSPQFLQIWIQIVRVVSKNIRPPLSDFLAQTLEKNSKRSLLRLYLQRNLTVKVNILWGQHSLALSA